MNTKISHYCSIKNECVSLDGEVLFKSDKKQSLLSFSKEVYRHFELNYPKFYKMDSLCKLSILASSILLDSLQEKVDEETAIVLSNKSGCIDIDKKHHSTISQGENSYARPANFVYTLPNISIGEISIKYKLKSENTFFIFDDYNPRFLMSYSKSLISLGHSKKVLNGWVEVNGNNYTAFLFLVEENGDITLTEENLLKLM